MDQKQSQFIEVQEVSDSDYVPVFGQSNNRKISKTNLFDQIKDETQIFIYPSTEQLQAANLTADPDWPVYVRNEETEYRLYKITSLAAGANDISLNNGLTATFQEEYSDIGFVVGPTVSTDGAIALFDGSGGIQLKNGVVPTTLGNNFISAPNSASPGYPKKNADNTLSMQTANQLKVDLDIDQVNNAGFSAKVKGPASALDGLVALFDGITGKLIKVGSSMSDYLASFLVTLYSIFPRKIDTWAAISSITPVGAGQLFDLAQHTSGGLGGGTLMAFSGSVTDDGGTQKNALGGFYLKRIYTGLPTVHMFGAIGNDFADETTAFQNCANTISGMVVVPNGIYRITNTINISRPNVKFIGEGSDVSHDSGSAYQTQTVVNWFGGAAGPMFNFSPAISASSQRLPGVGMLDVQLNGRGIVDNGLQVRSVVTGEFRRIYCYDCTAQSFFITCLIGGVSIAEASDTQSCIFENLSWRNDSGAAVQNAHGITLSDGTELGVSTGNTSFNTFISCGGRTINGHGFYLYSADNNVFIKCAASATGTGFSAYHNGQFSYSNLFMSWTSNKAMKFAGPASGAVGNSTKNVIMHIDTANSTPSPNADAGADYTYILDTGVHVGLRGQGGNFSNSLGGFASLSGLTSTVNIFSGSNAHMSLVNATQSWGINIDSATGNMRLIRGTGTGLLDLGSGVDVALKSLRITSGTAAPVAGTWARGDRCLQSQPSVGAPKGWMCTVAGTPGTWVSEGNL